VGDGAVSEGDRAVGEGDGAVGERDEAVSEGDRAVGEGDGAVCILMCMLCVDIVAHVLSIVRAIVRSRRC
jgi:hypothetical protein